MLIDEQKNIFENWLSQYEQLCYKIIRTYAESQQDRDDLFQQIMMQLWSSIPNFENKASPTTWIYRVALNTALVFKRTERRKWKRHGRMQLDFDLVSTSHDPPHDRQIINQLYDAIRTLPKIESSIILMHLDGLTYQQIADVLGISANNVGVKLNRAKKLLAQQLKGLIDDI